jgi:hypothetical protein
MLSNHSSRAGTFWSGMAILLSIVVASLVVVTRHLHLPVPLPAATTPNVQFSGERSRDLLEQICSSEASPRNVGSPGNLVTREILFDTFQAINKDITGVSLVQDEGSVGNTTVEFWSAANNSSGRAYWEVSTHENNAPCNVTECPYSPLCVNCIKSFIFRLRVASADFDATPRRGTLLLSAHYDGVPGTQAATDDGTGVAGTFELIYIYYTYLPINE